jgi:hypothetical protein
MCISSTHLHNTFISIFNSVMVVLYLCFILMSDFVNLYLPALHKLFCQQADTAFEVSMSSEQGENSDALFFFK